MGKQEKKTRCPVNFSGIIFSQKQALMKLDHWNNLFSKKNHTCISGLLRYQDKIQKLLNFYAFCSNVPVAFLPGNCE